MKKLVISVTLIAIVLSSYSQNKPTVSEERNVIKVNVLSLIVGTGSLFYERKIMDNISGQMGGGYLNYTINEGKFTGLILTPEARFYPKKKCHRRLLSFALPQISKFSD